ncbi:hypothetical protein M3Y99_01240300 [Aphelenchoides fujianensis]|nr:hypothetical protein M3Y99_01240300 [Aphelenchoides fujianensis]
MADSSPPAPLAPSSASAPALETTPVDSPLGLQHSTSANSAASSPVAAAHTPPSHRHHHPVLSRQFTPERRLNVFKPSLLHLYDAVGHDYAHCGYADSTTSSLLSESGSLNQVGFFSSIQMWDEHTRFSYVRNT